MAERLNLKFNDIVNDINSAAGRVVVDPNNPTPEGQQAVQAWLTAHPEYEPGTVTSQYMEGYEPPAEQLAESQPVDTPPQDVPPVETSAETVTPAEVPAETIPAEQTVTPAKTNSKREAVGSAIARWTPVVAQAAAYAMPSNGMDPTGESAGARSLAGQNQKTASDLSKIVQWNRQRAADNTLADKIAAAQATSRWKQNANTLGAEGGASVVASQNEAVTPDIMTQKQYQSQSMNAAGQTLTEADKHKRQAIANETNANRTDYFSGYNEALNNQATNLATAAGQQDQPKENTSKDTDTKDTATPEATKKPDGKVENTNTNTNTNTTGDTQQAVAETNQQSQATSDATNEVSEQQQLQGIADEINGIYNTVATLKTDAQQNAPQLRKLKERYDELKSQYDSLASKSKNPPPQVSVPDFGMFDGKYSEIPSTILEGVNTRF